MEIKANASDLLNQPVIIYSNYDSKSNSSTYLFIDKDKNYNKELDQLCRKIRKGSSVSLSISYKF
jgi:hypothetical protein